MTYGARNIAADFIAEFVKEEYQGRNNWENDAICTFAAGSNYVIHANVHTALYEVIRGRIVTLAVFAALSEVRGHDVIFLISIDQ